MPAYMTVGSNNLEAAKKFYDQLLAVIGMTPAFEHPSGGRVYSGKDGTIFGVLGPHNGKPATAGNGSMFGFALDSQEAVNAFHAKALALGGTDDGAPGPRGAAGAYFAYCRDLDGNKLCVFKFG